MQYVKISVTRFGEIPPLWQIIKNLWQYFYGLFGFQLTLAQFVFSLLKMAKYWKYNMVIWSHCTRSDFCTFAYFCNFFTSFGTEKNVPLPSGGNPVHRIEQRLFRKLPTLIRGHLNTILGLFYLVLSWYIREFTLCQQCHSLKLWDSFTCEQI